jgi:hypothetical protein
LNRSVCGVGGSVVGLEARSGREEPQLYGSLCEHYRVSSRATVLAEKSPSLRMAQLGKSNSNTNGGNGTTVINFPNV